MIIYRPTNLPKKSQSKTRGTTFQRVECRRRLAEQQCARTTQTRGRCAKFTGPRRMALQIKSRDPWLLWQHRDKFAASVGLITRVNTKQGRVFDSLTKIAESESKVWWWFGLWGGGVGWTRSVLAATRRSNRSLQELFSILLFPSGYRICVINPTPK